MNGTMSGDRISIRHNQLLLFGLNYTTPKWNGNAEYGRSVGKVCVRSRSINIQFLNCPMFVVGIKCALTAHTSN